MTFRDFIYNKATFINIKLANKAFTHLLTIVNIIETAIIALNINPFVYSANAKL